MAGDKSNESPTHKLFVPGISILGFGKMMIVSEGLEAQFVAVSVKIKVTLP